MLLTACIKNNEYDGNIGPSEIRESQTTNEVALTNLNLAIAYLTENNYDKALEKLNKSLAADSNYAPTYNIFGLLYQQLGDNDKAEKNFKRALSINSVDSSTLNNYGNFLCMLGRLSEAEKAFLKAAENPLYDAPEIAMTNAGQCLYQNEEIESAEKYYRLALQLNPRVSQALLKMSQINFDKQKFLSARAYIQRYEEIAPHNAKTLLLAIKIENELGDQDASSSYQLLLKNSFPDSNELTELQNIKTVGNEKIRKKEKVVENLAEQIPVIDREVKQKPIPKDISENNIQKNNVTNEQAIRSFVNQWANAWADQNVDKYLASYSKEFMPLKGKSRKRWQKERTERLLVPSFIKITLSNLKIDMRGNNYARVGFVQSYQSDTYKDKARKELLVEKTGDEWLIVQEQLAVYQENKKQEPIPKDISENNIQKNNVTNEQAIRSFVNQWANAWADQNVDKYLASYSKEFMPLKGKSRKRWQKERTERLLVPSFIKITLSNLKIDMRGNNYARVGFVQSYQSDTYKDKARKELLVEKTGDEWLIIKEK